MPSCSAAEPSYNYRMKKNPLIVVLGISTAFFVIFMIVVGVFMNSLGTGSKGQKKLFAKSNNVGIIEINGAIMDSKKWVEQVETFAEDEMIKAVIIRVNSPGGAVGPSQEVHDAVKKLAAKKPVYASMGSVAASGGYYIAVATKKIYANPGTITASIGVIMQFMDMSKLFQWAKVSPYNIKTGKFKDVGSPNREMSAEERELMLGMAMNVLGQFRRAVAEGRKLPMDKVVEISDGRIMSGEQAKTSKLVDELGGLADAVAAIAKEAGIEGKPHMIYASKKKSPIERLFDGGDDADSESRSNITGIARLISSFRFLLGENAEMAPVKTTASGPMFILPNFSN